MDRYEAQILEVSLQPSKQSLGNAVTLEFRYDVELEHRGVRSAGIKHEVPCVRELWPLTDPDRHEQIAFARLLFKQADRKEA